MGLSLNNKLRAGIKFLKSKVKRKRIPLVVPFQLTSNCNLDCEYCDFKAGEEVSTSEACNMLRDLRQLGTEKIVFTGGEPLLHPGFKELMDLARSLRFEINVNSNGLLVPDNLEAVKQADVLVISLDGPKKINDSLRGSGSFEGAFNAIKVMEGHKEKLRFTCVLNKKNLNALEWLLRRAKELEIPINFQPVISSPRGTKNHPRLGLNREELSQALAKIAYYKRKNPEVVRPSLYTLKKLKNIYLDREQFNCERGMIVGRVEGKFLTPCARAARQERTKIGGSIKQAWNQLNPRPECNYTCCTSSIELASIWNLKFMSIINQLGNNSY